MNVLVTGSNGFLGSHLCRALAARGDRVRGLVRATSDVSLLEGIPIERALGDITAPDSLPPAVAGMDVVYHVAGAVSDWGTPAWFRRINVDGTRHVLAAASAAGVQRVVYVSSAAVHSFLDRQDMDETSPQLPTPFPYCQSKREAEAVALDYHRAGRVAVAIVRPGDIYGPGDRVALLRLAGLLRRGLVPYVGDGRKLGAHTYVGNLVDALILAGTHPGAPGEAFVITDGTGVTWRDHFAGLARAAGLPQPWVQVPAPLAAAAASALEALYRGLRLHGRPPITRYLVAHLRSDFHFSIAKASRMLGYAPALDTDTTLQRTADWLHTIVTERSAS
ncbi:MAG: NAD-dependent epimerase/dehydratase family protein [Chloroflexota bacterium]